MTAIEVADKLARYFEGLFLRPYICSAGYRTVGFGHLYPKGGAITEKQAVAFLQSDLTIALLGAIRQCPGLVARQEALGAITDFCFNLGVGRLQASTLKRRINQQDWEGARKELNRWVYAGGRKLKGLVARRAAETRFLPQTMVN